MKLWIRLNANTPDDPRVHKLAEQLGISPSHALGLVVRVWCAMAGHAQDGVLGDIPPRAIAAWAGWGGSRLTNADKFATAFRELFADEHGNAPDYQDLQGKLIERMERDRARKRPKISTEIPRTFRGNSAATERNGTPDFPNPSELGEGRRRR
jgi:hypothetical protein